MISLKPKEFWLYQADDLSLFFRMNNKLSSLIFTLIGTIIILLNIVIIIPIGGFFLNYGIDSLSILEMVGVMGDGVQSLMIFSPWIFAGIFLLGIAFLGIFFNKKRGYGLLLFMSRVVSFLAVLMMVIKTYFYMGKFPLNAFAGVLLIIGGFLSWYACFWGYIKKQLLETWIPITIRIISFILFGGLLYVFPSGGNIPNYYNLSFGILQPIYSPRTLDSKELIFGISFLINLWISSLCVHVLVYEYGSVITTRKYRRKGLSIFLLLLLGGIIAIWSKKILFTEPIYEAKKYDTLFIKEGYQSDTIKENNGYYRQNQRLGTHTGFLKKIGKHPFVIQNEETQSGFVLSGFTQFWNAFSGEFSKELTGLQDILITPYAMLNIDADIQENLGSESENLRARTILLNTVVLGLCKSQQCDLGFPYRMDRYKFLDMRIKSGQGIIQSLITLVSLQKTLSGATEILPYLTPTQRQELKIFILPYNIITLHKNMLVQEYYFTYSVGIKNIQDHMKTKKIDLPKWILDLDYTNFLMKENFSKIFSGGKVQTERPKGLVYNSQGYTLLNALLPRLGSIYNRFTDLELQKNDLLRQLQK